MKICNQSNSNKKMFSELKAGDVYKLHGDILNLRMKLSEGGAVDLTTGNIQSILHPTTHLIIPLPNACICLEGCDET